MTFLMHMLKKLSTLHFFLFLYTSHIHWLKVFTYIKITMSKCHSKHKNVMTSYHHDHYEYNYVERSDLLWWSQFQNLIFSSTSWINSIPKQYFTNPIITACGIQLLVNGWSYCCPSYTPFYFTGKLNGSKFLCLLPQCELFNQYLLCDVLCFIRHVQVH